MSLKAGEIGSQINSIINSMLGEFIRSHWMEIEGKWTPEPVMKEQRIRNGVRYWLDKNGKEYLKPEAIKVYLDSDVTPWPVLSPISIDRAMLVVSFSSEEVSIDIVERET